MNHIHKPHSRIPFTNQLHEFKSRTIFTIGIYEPYSQINFMNLNQQFIINYNQQNQFRLTRFIHFTTLVYSSHNIIFYITLHIHSSTSHFHISQIQGLSHCSHFTDFVPQTQIHFEHTNLNSISVAQINPYTTDTTNLHTKQNYKN